MANAIVPNKLVSGGLPAHTGAATTDYLTDGYLTNWKSSSAKEIALNVGEGPTKLRINWESYGDCAWATDFTSGCGHSGVALSNFKIMTSANSTDGSNGDWEVAATIENNPVMARGVDIEFAGKSWFKFVSEGDVGQILEIEAFDMSAGGTDTWFFMGTSISQMGIKQQDTDSTTAQIIHAKFPEYTPAMLRGGIGCINSSEVVEHLGEYLEYAGNVKFWAIEMGTNDAWGGGDWNLATYKKNMQTIIDSAKAHGIT
ncbi:MAG: SGNH/GDSL hydrolase family protein, partial [Fibrobacter sp.]|nr:SGNH/GDSL hydrolase family protein [Fibrobacter sp.]